MSIFPWTSVVTDPSSCVTCTNLFPLYLYVQYLSESSDCTSSNGSILDILPCDIQVSVNTTCSDGAKLHKLCSWRSKGNTIAKLHQQVHWLHLTVWSCGTQSAQASNRSSWLNAPSMLLFVHACVIIVNNPIGCIPAILLNIGVSVTVNISINLKLNKLVCAIPFPLFYGSWMTILYERSVWNGHQKYTVPHRAHHRAWARSSLMPLMPRDMRTLRNMKEGFM
jgi:hypothetical protein